MMAVTFVANSRVLGYRPGQVVKVEDKDMTNQLRALLARGRHLTLIDPLEIDVKSEVADPPKPKPKAAKVESDGGTTSSSNPKKRGPFSGTDNGHQDPPGNGGSKEGTTEHTGH